MAHVIQRSFLLQAHVKMSENCAITAGTETRRVKTQVKQASFGYYSMVLQSTCYSCSLQLVGVQCIVDSAVV